jgi:predicted  nucleic acid-binding Zn-ribbon protein
VATIASFVAMWYLHLLGSLTQQVEKLEETVTDLKANSDKLHTELLAFQTLRKNLELYAEDTKEDFSKVIYDMNKAFERLEELTKNNEKILIARVAQDLEFLDGKEGMNSEEYRRFIARIPNNLKPKFDELGYKSFENVAGKDKVVDYKELKGIVETLA